MQVNKDEAIFICNTLRKYGNIELPAMGFSMYPVIKNGDICTFTQCNPEQLNKYDIVLFYSPQGKLVAHRFFDKKETLQTISYLFKGDTNIRIDDPIPQELILGKLISIKRKNKQYSVTNIKFFIWNKIALIYPKLPYYIRTILLNSN